MRVHMEKRGQGDPIVFVHGTGLSPETWAAQMAALEGRFTVVAFDLLGHGQRQIVFAIEKERAAHLPGGRPLDY